MFLLAQLSADTGSSLMTFLVGGSAALFLINQALTFYKQHIKEQPTPANTYATKDEMKQAHGRMTREKDEFDRQIRELKEEQERLDQKLDNKIDDLNERIDAVPERTINLLAKTKGLI